MRTVEIEPTFESWQTAARDLLQAGVAPSEVRWREIAAGVQPSLPAKTAASSSQSARVPREFLDLARQAASASDTARWQVLYDVLWRLSPGDRDLLKDPRNPSVRRLRALVTQRAAEPAPDRDGPAPYAPSGDTLRGLT